MNKIKEQLPIELIRAIEAPKCRNEIELAILDEVCRHYAMGTLSARLIQAHNA